VKTSADLEAWLAASRAHEEGRPVRGALGPVAGLWTCLTRVEASIHLVGKLSGGVSTANRPPCSCGQGRCEDSAMADPLNDLDSDDWRRIRDALRYQGRDLHHRSFAVTSSRRELLWQEMDRCLALAERIDAALSDG